jgi:hypothetical protein
MPPRRKGRKRKKGGSQSGGNILKKIGNAVKKLDQVAKVVKPATIVKGALDTIAPGYRNSKYGKYLETGLNIAKSRGYGRNPQFI